MVSYNIGSKGTKNRKRVLILVVVEDGLVRQAVYVIFRVCTVLILVVVEDGLVHDVERKSSKTIEVLILVVVEDGLVLLII